MSGLAIDAGTSMIKAVLFGSDGSQTALARRATAVSRPAPAHSEQDMEEVWAAVAETARSAIAHATGEVRFVAITGQGDGCWLVDESGDPTGPAILWNDGRAAAIVEEWHADGVLEQAFRINGSIGFAGLPHAILTWLAEEDPDRLRRSTRTLTCNGFVFGRMTGSLVADSSDAAVPFLDIRTGEYSSDLLELYGLSWAQRLLPDIVADDRRVGRLRPEVAAAWGLPAGTPVVLAPYDIVATAIGVGAVSAGRSCGILGTTLCVEVVTDTVDSSSEPAGLTVPFGVSGLHLRAFPTLAGTEVIDWALGVLGLERPEDLVGLAAQAPPGSGGIAFLPYLSPAGERAPFLDAAARGSVHGISFEHDRGHLARAVLEGLTMVVRDCLEAAPTSPLRLGVSGGGARSDRWCQLIADVTGVPTERSADEEVGARGADLYGLVATGEEPDLARAAARHVRLGRAFTPDAARHSAYTELHAIYSELRAAEARVGWPRLKQFRETPVRAIDA